MSHPLALPRVSRRVIACLAAALFPAAAHAQATSTHASATQPAWPGGMISIARAESFVHTADTVNIAGRAVTASGQLITTGFNVAIDDGSGGIRLFVRHGAPHVDIGDSIEARGLVREYRGDRELVVSAIHVVPGARRIVPTLTLPLKPASFAANWGRLATVQGRPVALGHSEGGEWLRIVNTEFADSGAVTIWVSADHGGHVKLDPLRDATLVRVTGVVTAYRDNPEDAIVWQIVPRDDRDVARIGAPLWREIAGLWAMIAVVVIGIGVLVTRAVGRRQARALRETEARYQQLVSLIPDALIVHDRRQILFANPAAARMLEVETERALVGQDLDLYTSEATRPHVGEREVGDRSAAARAASTSGTPVRGQLVSAHGTRVDVELTASPCRFHDRDATVVLARDITQQLRVERELESLALLDELTGLRNRRGFSLFAEQELARARRYGKAAVLVFADMDRLKRINDEHGHAAGDAALRAVAQALRTTARESDIVARWAGDEFVALLLESGDGIGERFIERFQSALPVHAIEAGIAFPVSATLGTTVLPADGSVTLRDALAAADAELYRHKGHARTEAVSLPTPAMGTVRQR